MPKKITARAGLDLPLRIIVARPPSGVMFCVQAKPGEHLSRTRSADRDLTFDVDVRVADGDPLRLLGPVVQGPPAQRFIYICSGTYAGDTGTYWSRRAKVPLEGITRELIAKAKPNTRLSATIQGKAGDGGPACASVALLGSGWKWTS